MPLYRSFESERTKNVATFLFKAQFKRISKTQKEPTQKSKHSKGPIPVQLKNQRNYCKDTRYAPTDNKYEGPTQQRTNAVKQRRSEWGEPV